MKLKAGTHLQQDVQICHPVAAVSLAISSPLPVSTC